MKNQFSGMTFAILASNGFEDAAFLNIHKILRGTGAALKVVSSDTGLISGLSESGWGHNHAVDAPLNTALGVDYDAVLVLPGETSHKKLLTTAHTKRFVGSFKSAEKPVLAIGNAVSLLDDLQQMNDDVMVIEAIDDAFVASLEAALITEQTLKEAA